jgi:protein-tyrosine kinase
MNMENRATLVEKIPTLTQRAETIGKLLLDQGKLSETDITRVLIEQKAENLRFGEAALRLGLVEHEDVMRALAHQFEYCYMPVGDQSLSDIIVAAHHPFSEQAEALRALRSQLMLRWFSGRRRCLALAAARSGDGCSRVAANLAVTFSQLGQRTLLIDTNLRRPRQHQLFGLKNHGGLSNVLTGRGGLNEAAVRVDPLRNLYVLCAGAVPPNPQELLSRATFLHLLGHAAKEFDSVILDTAPAALCVDAQIVAAAAGGCLLVARRDHSRLAELERFKEQLAPAGSTIVGAVINDKRLSKKKFV